MTHTKLLPGMAVIRRATALATALLLSVLVPSAGAQDVPVDGQLLVQGVESAGTAFGSGSLYAFQATPGGSGEVQVTFEAARVQLDDGSPEARTQTFTGASGTFAAGGAGEALVHPTAAGLAVLDFELLASGDFAVNSSQDVPFHFPAAAGPLRYRSEGNVPLFGSSGQSLRLDTSGALTLWITGGTFSLEHDGGRWNAAGPTSVLRMRLEQATLAMDLAGRSSRMTVDAYSGSNSGRLTLAHATGPLQLDDDAFQLDDTGVQLDGVVTVQLSSESADRIRADVAATNARVDFLSGGSVEQPPTANDGLLPLGGWVALVAVTGLLAFGLGGYLVYRRRNAPMGYYSMLAEAAMLRGDYGLALRQTERALRQNPSDPQMLATKGLSLLQLGRDPEAFRFATNAHQVVPGGSPVLAYVAASAAARTGQVDEAATWLARAIQGSERFRTEAESNPIFEQVRRAHAELWPAHA